MSAVRFLCDEHVDHSLAEAIGNREPGVEMLFVGDAGTPAFGSTDPALLQWVEQRKYALVSADRRTIPAHISEHLALGRHT